MENDALLFPMIRLLVRTWEECESVMGDLFSLARSTAMRAEKVRTDYDVIRMLLDVKTILEKAGELKKNIEDNQLRYDGCTMALNLSRSF
ncbi:MAG: hypothetical protein GY820_19075 [Gammaproteobacteria bacterium]|nr:hypothetical protein [Gammaproteobacteria bacterium]